MGLMPRERVLCALNHQEPDRVPLFIGAGGRHYGAWAGL